MGMEGGERKRKQEGKIKKRESRIEGRNNLSSKEEKKKEERKKEGKKGKKKDKERNKKA